MTEQISAAEEKLHLAICEAVLLLNHGEEIAPRVGTILRSALFNYEPATNPEEISSKPVAANDADMPRWQLAQAALPKETP